MTYGKFYFLCGVLNFFLELKRDRSIRTFCKFSVVVKAVPDIFNEVLVS